VALDEVLGLVALGALPGLLVAAVQVLGLEPAGAAASAYEVVVLAAGLAAVVAVAWRLLAVERVVVEHVAAGRAAAVVSNSDRQQRRIAAAAASYGLCLLAIPLKLGQHMSARLWRQVEAAPVAGVDEVEAALPAWEVVVLLVG